LGPLDDLFLTPHLAYAFGDDSKAPSDTHYFIYAHSHWASKVTSHTEQCNVDWLYFFQRRQYF
jgi:hypothetical protein